MCKLTIGLSLQRNHYEIMLNDVINRAPVEACGMVAGIDGKSEKIFVVTNILNSRVRFRIAPQEQLNVFNEIEDLGLELIAIYHSHPRGPDGPSSTDISEFFYPGTISLIWSRKNQDWVCHGFRIDSGNVKKVPVLILD